MKYLAGYSTLEKKSYQTTQQKTLMHSQPTITYKYDHNQHLLFPLHNNNTTHKCPLIFLQTKLLLAKLPSQRLHYHSHPGSDPLRHGYPSAGI